MRIHVPAIPGQPTLRSNSACAYTAKINKFAQMLVPRGHEVIVYSGAENDSPATEHVNAYGDFPYLDFQPMLWREPNEWAADAIRERAEPGDFLGIIGGRCQETLAAQLPEMLAVEWGIGYSGTFTDYRVFESYAWMHTVYGAQQGAHEGDGRFFDTVIPNYFDVDDFPTGEGGDYLLYTGRLIERKGVHIASQVAEEMGLELKIAGSGDYRPNYGEYLGHVGPDERGELMAGAKALLAPTLYIEPFGGVTIEAMLCGTPVITTDFGAFTETVIPGFNGHRCRTLGEFKWAVEQDYDREAIRRHAIANYSLEAVAPKYEAYFDQLETLWSDGWNSDFEALSRNRCAKALPEVTLTSNRERQGP